MHHLTAKTLHILSTVVAVFVVFFSVITYRIGSVAATAGQIMKLTTSDGGSTFYVGRCFRTNIEVQTDNLNANSVDVILSYNSSYIQPFTGSGCTVAATAMQSNGLFGAYPSNSIGGGLVTVTAYDPTGSNPVNTGAAPADNLLGHIFWKVIATSGSYVLPFQFSVGSTTDTNMAQQSGDGSDVLDSVENLTLILAADAGTPTFSSLSPSNGATSVSVTTGVSYAFADTGAGVGTGTLTHSLNRTGKSMTFSNCIRTNSNPVSSCSVTMSSVGTLSYNTLYRIHATGSDLASPTANTGNQIWTFTTEDDTNAPYISGKNPAVGALGVSSASNIVFHVKDYKANAGVTPGLGVDISTVSVTVTPSGGSPITYTSASPQFSYTGTSEDYTVTINPTADFPPNTTITVAISASDLHSPANAMTTDSYVFSTADTTKPTISSLSPDADATGVTTSTDVLFHVTDTGAGISISHTTVTINGVAYTSASPEFSYTGTSADYVITINPSTNFSDNSVVSVSISTQDQGSTPNTVTTTYGFYVGSTTTTTAGTTTTCATATTTGGNSRATNNILTSIASIDLPRIIARKRIPGTDTIVHETLSEDDARNVRTCYVDELPVHAAAPKKTHYTDVVEGAWYENALHSFLQLGILDATKKTFRPAATALRAELAKVLGALNGAAPETWPKPYQFDDLEDGAWYVRYVELAGNKGWMRGYKNCLGTHPCFVMPLSTITRAEAVAMIVRYYGIEKIGVAPRFADIQESAWYAPVMQAAADHCILRGNDKGRAEPEALLTRAEMVVFIERAKQDLYYGIDCGSSASAQVDTVAIHNDASPDTSGAIGILAALTSLATIGIVGRCIVALEGFIV